jgi:predicted XRE-type DNA-binding protein
MMKDKYDKIIDQFRCYYDYLYDQVVDWWPSGRTYITVKLEDSTLLEFDSFDNTIRRVQPNDYSKDAVAIRKDIGHNLKKIIMTRGMPQSEIAEKCGITEAMLSRYIHGTSMPGVDKIYALASALDCRTIDILGETYSE